VGAGTTHEESVIREFPRFASPYGRSDTYKKGMDLTIANPVRLLCCSHDMVDSTFLLTTAVNLLINLVYAIAVFGVAFLTFMWSDKILCKNIDFMEEIKRGNMAAAIFASVKLLFIAFVIAAALNS
jgi:Domain of Unknown Function (DUF350)